jgi:hypothetical protein
MECCGPHHDFGHTSRSCVDHVTPTAAKKGTRPCVSNEEPGTYDPLALLVLSFCTGCASGILTTRVINGIFEAQDWLAQRTARGQETKAVATDHRKLWIETLKLDVVATLLIVAFATAVFPSLPSHIARELVHS